MRTIHRALLGVSSSILACSPTAAPTPPSDPAPQVATPAAPDAPFPRVEIHFTDHTADEGAWSTTTLRVDGVFESEHEVSNGGMTSTVTQCTGRIDSTVATNWLSRMQADATLDSRPDVPGYAEAMDRGVTESYRVQFFESATTSAWAESERWGADRLQPLFDRMHDTQTCKTFAR